MISFHDSPRLGAPLGFPLTPFGNGLPLGFFFGDTPLLSANLSLILPSTVQLPVIRPRHAAPPVFGIQLHPFVSAGVGFHLFTHFQHFVKTIIPYSRRGEHRSSPGSLTFTARSHMPPVRRPYLRRVLCCLCLRKPDKIPLTNRTSGRASHAIFTL
jgi:hypothetical protein